MKILIIGNMGYVGSSAVKAFREYWPDASIIGYDLAIFSQCLSSNDPIPERYLDAQFFGDVRSFDTKLLKEVDTVVYLAAISNDPMGNEFEALTKRINQDCAVEIAKECKQNQVKRFVFASSCSVYGFAENDARTEKSELNPLTAYAKSKVHSESKLLELADASLQVTCLRFATACGMSPRLRLDLVLNDFVAGAMVNKKIEILSDGTPLRPLIDVADMARALAWGCVRDGEDGLVVNAGSNDWNYQVKDLAYAVKNVLGDDIDIMINANAAPDKRSYRVNFDKFKSLAPDFYPIINLEDSIRRISDGLAKIDFDDINYRESSWIRLNVLRDAVHTGFI